MNLPDLLNQPIKPLRDLLRGPVKRINGLLDLMSIPKKENALATLTPIPPNIPFPLPIHSSLLPLDPNLTRTHTFVIAVAPLGDVFRERNPLSVDDRGIRARAEKQLECMLCPLARTDPYMCDAGRINELTRPDKLDRRASDLFDAIWSEVQIRYARIAPILTPLCLPWKRSVYSPESPITSRAHRGEQ